VSPQINSSLVFKIALAFYPGFVRGRVNRSFLISYVTAGNIRVKRS